MTSYTNYLSYPVGAEVISVALEDVPQYNQLLIVFTRGGWTEISTGSEQVSSFMRTFAASLNFYSGSAYLHVYAVKSEYRQLVRKAIIDYGLPAIKVWLSLPRPQTWYEGLRVLTVGIALNTEEICFVETMNQKVVSFKGVSRPS